MERLSFSHLQRPVPEAMTTAVCHVVARLSDGIISRNSVKNRPKKPYKVFDCSITLCLFLNEGAEQETYFLCGPQARARLLWIIGTGEQEGPGMNPYTRVEANPRGSQ